MVLYADLIAVPDFPTGAMENWGLITFKLTSILYHPGKSSDSNRQWVAVVVAHELSHQVNLLTNEFIAFNRLWPGNKLLFFFTNNWIDWTSNLINNNRKVDCSQSPVFLMIVLIERFALWLAILDPMSVKSTVYLGGQGRCRSKPQRPPPRYIRNQGSHPCRYKVLDPDHLMKK